MTKAKFEAEKTQFCDVEQLLRGHLSARATADSQLSRIGKSAIHCVLPGGIDEEKAVYHVVGEFDSGSRW